MQAYKYGEGRKWTRRTSHLLDKQLEVASRYESNEGDGERGGGGGGGYEYLRWAHPRLWAVGCGLLAGDKWSRLAVSSCDLFLWQTVRPSGREADKFKSVDHVFYISRRVAEH